jgi:hypothetical protein
MNAQGIASTSRLFSPNVDDEQCCFRARKGREVPHSATSAATSGRDRGPEGTDGKFHIVRQAQQPRRTLLHRAPKSDTSLGLSPGPMERTLSQLHIFFSTTGTRWVHAKMRDRIAWLCSASIRGGGTGILLGYDRQTFFETQVLADPAISLERAKHNNPESLTRPYSLTHVKEVPEQPDYLSHLKNAR